MMYTFLSFINDHLLEVVVGILVSKTGGTSVSNSRVIAEPSLQVMTKAGDTLYRFQFSAQTS